MENATEIDNDVVVTPTPTKITLSLVKGSDSSKIKFSVTEEKTAKGILLHVGVLADLFKVLTPAQKELVTPEIEAAVQELLDDNADNFAQIVKGAYQKIEGVHFIREEEDGVTYDTALDAANWPTKRCHAAMNGMLRRIAVESKVLKQEQAEAFWPGYTAKKVVRRVKKA